MAREHVDGVRSRAAVFGHPIHPMLIPFPIAFLTAALATDLMYWRTNDDFWARASLWLVGAGLVMGVLAAVFGLIDFTTIRQVQRHKDAWIHALGNSAALLLAFVSFWIRIDDPQDAVLPPGLILSLVIAGILTVTGWYGGELSYRHKIGVIPD